MRVLFLIFILLLFRCGSPQNKIDEEYPNGSALKYNTLLTSERLLQDENYFIFQVNAFYGTEYYEPYLLFYRKDNLKLELSIYNPGKVHSLKNKVIKGYYNQYRSKKINYKLKNGYLFSFEKKEPSNIKKEDLGVLSLKTIQKDTLIFKTTTSELEVKYHLNEVVFSTFNKNLFQVYNFSDSSIVYKSYEINQLKLKRNIWNYINGN